MSFRYSSLGLVLFTAWMALHDSWATDIPYRKASTRTATRQASVNALVQLHGAPVLVAGTWRLLGPLKDTSSATAETESPTALVPGFSKEHVGMEGRKLRWTPRNELKADGASHVIARFSDAQSRRFLLHQSIESDRICVGLLTIGVTGVVEIWVNGAPVHDRLGVSDRIEPLQIAVRLDKGRNELMVQIHCSELETVFSSCLTGISVQDPSQVKQWLGRLEALLEADFPEGESAFYTIRDIPLPDGIILEPGGVAFMPDGRLMVATRRGDIWARTPGIGSWHQFASGLHEPLGLWVEGSNSVVVAQRPELTRILDRNNDGVADRFETLTARFGLSGNYHEFHFGPAGDPSGNLYATLNIAFENQDAPDADYRGWVYRFDNKGGFSPWASGFRSPAGLGVSPAGDLFVTDNQGEWRATSALYHVRQGRFYGHPSRKTGTTGAPVIAEGRPGSSSSITAPAVWFVHEALGRSPTQPVWDTTGGKFGPFSGQMLVGDLTKSLLTRVALEEVHGEFQGAVFPFRRGFASGVLRMAWSPDGELILGETDRGWGSAGGRPFALQSLSWTGQVPLEMLTVNLTANGFDLTFTAVLDVSRGLNPESFQLRSFRYESSQSYRTGPLDIRTETVKRVAVSTDRKKISLFVPRLEAARVYEIRALGLRSQSGLPLLHPEAYYTLNRLR